MDTKKGVNTPDKKGKPRNRKSEQLTREELLAFRKKARKALTLRDVSEELGINEGTRKSIFTKGQGSPATIQKVREYINK